MTWRKNEGTNKWKNKSTNQQKVSVYRVVEVVNFINVLKNTSKGDAMIIFVDWLQPTTSMRFFFSFACDIYHRHLIKLYLLPSLVGPLANVSAVTGSSATNLSFRRSSFRSSRTRSKCRVRFSAWLIMTSTPDDMRASYINQTATVNHTFVFVYIRGYYILFGECWNEGNHNKVLRIINKLSGLSQLPAQQ